MSVGVRLPAERVINYIQDETLIEERNLPGHPVWMERAKCLEMAKAGSNFMTDLHLETDQERLEWNLKIGRAICNSVCEVQQQCLAFSIRNNVPGFRAGMTESERAAYAAAMMPDKVVRLEPDQIIDLR